MVAGFSGAERGSVLSGIGGVGGPLFRGGCLCRFGSAGPTGSVDFVVTREELRSVVDIEGVMASFLMVAIDRIGKLCTHRVSWNDLLIVRQSNEVGDLVKDAIDCGCFVADIPIMLLQRIG
jgi:hypothetical protein